MVYAGRISNVNVEYFMNSRLKWNYLKNKTRNKKLSVGPSNFFLTLNAKRIYGYLFSFEGWIRSQTNKNIILIVMLM